MKGQYTVVGLETEYGIMIENQQELDPSAVSQLFFNLWRPENLVNWDFATESPSQDARGWFDLNTPLTSHDQSISSISGLISAAPEAQLLDLTLANNIKLLDRTNFNAMLGNGARFYIDHTHPEYSTPECASLLDLIAADVAGQEFLAKVATQASAKLPQGQQFALYRNNTDFHGASYGCHENYLMSAAAYDVLFGNRQHRLFTFLIPFLVTRQIFCGAGKTGAEFGEPTNFQISQRADFIETVLGLQTVYRRPIVNTRNEPHADKEKFRRLHVIVGDANMAETSTYLKVGTTQIILNMLEAEFVNLDLTLEDPVSAIKAVSRDLTCKKALIRLESKNKPSSALDIQRRYLARARKFLDKYGSTAEQEAVWAKWDQVLTALAEDPDKLGRQIDWVIKRQLLEGQIANRNIEWDNPLVKEMDTRYHAINPSQSIYHILCSKNMIDKMVSDQKVKSFSSQPPPDTRAALRSKLLSSIGQSALAVNWDCIIVYQPREKNLMRISLSDPTFSGDNLIPSLQKADDPILFASKNLPVEILKNGAREYEQKKEENIQSSNP